MKMTQFYNKIQDVKEFHEKHNWVEQSEEKTAYLLTEEKQEHDEATHIQDELDACVDYLYVWIGGLLRGQKLPFDKHIEWCIKELHGDVFGQWWGYVQQANMTKGTNGKSVVKDNKIMKGEDFLPPEHFAKLDGFFDRHPKYAK